MKTMKKIVALLAVALMLCSILPLSVFAADTYELATSIEVGDTVVLAVNSKKMELNGISTTSTKYGLGVAYTGAPVGAYALTVEEGYTAGTYSFKCPNGQYLYWTSGNSLNTNATKNANTSWNVSFSGDNAVITNAKDNARKLQWNASSPRFACYTGSQTAIQLYKLSGGEEPPVTCEHVWVDANCTTPKTCSLCGETEGDALGHSYGEGEETVAPDCENAGELSYTCSVCGDVKTEAIAANGHNYVDGACSVCGAEEPNVIEYTIDFTSTAQRVSFSTSEQVWQNGGLTVTNSKAGSTSNVADYSNPVRFYKSSTVTIACNGMTSLVISTSGNSWADTLTNAGLTYTVDGTVYTITFAEPTDSITLTCAAQIRALNITATAAKAEGEPDCEHTNAVACDKYCPDCGALINEEAAHKSNAEYPCYDGTCEYCGDTIEGDGHSFDENDVCTVCGQAPIPENPVDPANPQEYVFADYAAGVQYAEGEKHYLDNAVTVITNQAHFTTQLRIYSSETNNATVIIKSKKDISAIVLNAGNKVDVLNLYVSEDGEVYEAIEITASIYNDYTVLIPEMTKYIKLDVAGDQQIRVAKMTLYFDGEVPHTHEYDNDCDVDCNTCGETREVPDHVYTDAFDTSCNVCGAIRDVVAPATAHGFSRSEDVRGLAVKFEVPVTGMGIDVTTAIYDNATVNGYKLISMGAIADNGVSQKAIPAVYLCDDDVSASAKFAIRIINIPEGKEDVQITFTPYVIVEIDGVETTIYGEAVSSSFNG